MALNPGGFFLGSSNIDHELPPPTPESITDFSGEETDSQSTTSPLSRPDAHPRPSGKSSSGLVAFGSLRLICKNQSNETWSMYSGGQLMDFPPEALRDPARRGWLHLEQIEHASRPDLGSCRVFLLPEDVDRSVRASPKPFRKIIKWLISVVDTSPRTWSGLWEESCNPQTYGVPASDQDESLFYIFNTLEPPVAGPIEGSPHVVAAMDDILTDTIAGVKTKLYPYQKRSVASMLRREVAPLRSQDPRKPSYIDLQGNSFYMDVFDGIVVRHSHLYEEPLGGFLAETMGYGKTLACISLILATRGHYPHLPEARIEQAQPPVYEKTPSLLSMAARALRRKALPWKAEFHALKSQGYHYDRCLEELHKYQREFGEPIFTPTTPGRRVSRRESERTLRLSSSTLVILPANLVFQWQHEISKHTEPGALDVLVLDMSVKSIPEWRELINYDVVLISKNRLDQEYRDDDLHQGKRTASSDRFSSQLTELRWLRVICDEGHAFASSASRTRTMAMLDKLSIERRWIISGTPSSSLIGVDVNLAADETRKGRRRDSIDTALERRRIPDSVKQEEKDMERLRLIIVGYFKLKPWANQKGADQANWKKYLSPFDAKGNRRCAPGLRPLLQSLMVRHRVKDIDADVTLPALHNRTVYLTPTYSDRLTLNLFMMVLASNAVTSERTDEDYMHHPKNRKTLEILISNLRQSTFYWVGFTEQQVRETIKVCNNYLEKQSENSCPSTEDTRLLEDAILHAESALANPAWSATSKLHQMGVFIEGFPHHAAAAWSLHGGDSSPLLIGTQQVLEMQKHVRSHIHEEDPTAGLIGAGMRAMTEARKRAEDETEKSSKGTKVGSATTAANGTSSSTTSQPPPGVVEEPKLRHTLTRPLTSTSGTALKSPSPHKRSHHTITPPPTPPSAATIAALTNPTITGFMSAKLTYLCNSLLAQPADTKSLIFYDANNTAFWLAEALELLGISFLIYSNTLPAATRAKYLGMFNNDEPDLKIAQAATSTTTEPDSDVNPVKWRVLLMDLRQASTGLHCAAASRVYIVTPIWRREVEAQAIKRAHRIGQMKEVFVETLVLRGTIEERFWRRRRAVGEEDAGGDVAEGGVGSGDGGKEDKNVTSPVATRAGHGPAGGTHKHTAHGAGGMTSGGWLEDEGVVGIIKSEGFLEMGTDEGRKRDGTEEAARLDNGVMLFARELQVRREMAELSDGDRCGAGQCSDVLARGKGYGQQAVLGREKKRRRWNREAQMAGEAAGKGQGILKGTGKGVVTFAEPPTPPAVRDEPLAHSLTVGAVQVTQSGSIFGGASLLPPPPPPPPPPPLSEQQGQRRKVGFAIDVPLRPGDSASGTGGTDAAGDDTGNGAGSDPTEGGLIH